MRLPVVLLCGLGVVAMATPALAVDIVFDYSMDTSGFFGNVTAKATLEAVGNEFSAMLGDSLSAIEPDALNTWEAVFARPDTGINGSWVNNATIPADTLVIYVGARDLGDSIFEAGPGGWNANGYQPWFDTLANRGEFNADGAGATDFAPWGGVIAFDDDGVGYGWNFSAYTWPGYNDADFLTAAYMAMGRVLGYGTSDSWQTFTQWTGSQWAFNGPASVAEYGDVVPMSSDQSVWADGLMSMSDGAPQEVVMDGQLYIGDRKYMTDLDWAGLDDIGWEVVPEPTSMAVLLGAALMGFARRRHIG